jgi:hypothetical protein
MYRRGPPQLRPELLQKAGQRQDLRAHVLVQLVELRRKLVADFNDPAHPYTMTYTPYDVDSIYTPPVSRAVRASSLPVRRPGAQEKPKRVKSTGPPPVRLELYFRCGLTHYGTSGPRAVGKIRKRLTQRRDNRVHPGAFFASRRESVAHAADRMDVPGGLRVVFQLLAQPGDVHIDGPG